ncbi:MAG: LuxR C-terminal-related transcriptional regulator [Pseudonocardiaceae bacterium]
MTTVESTRTVDVTLVLRDEVLKYGVERMLQSLSIVRRFYIYESVAEAIEGLGVERPDLFIVALREIKETGPCVLDHAHGRDAKLLLLLDVSDPAQLSRAVASIRADGFLHTHELTTRTLEEAIERVTSGEMPIPSKLAKTLLERVRAEDARAATSTPARMTAREQQVLALLVEGLSNKQIARRLGISAHGAKRLVANILTKLGCPNRTLAVVKALAEGLHHSGAPAGVNKVG